MQLGNYTEKILLSFIPKFFGILLLFLLFQASTLTHAATSQYCTVNNPTTGFSSSGLQNDKGGCVVKSMSGETVYDSSSKGYIITNDNDGTFKDNKGNVMSKEEDKWCTTASTCISGIVYIFTVSFASILAYIGSAVFNLGVQMSLQSAAYSQLFLTTGWAAARDIANMMFIFILIYIAVTIIYSAETHGTMKTLAAVIVMALLINFSFFITRVVVDAGNILAVQFYNAVPALSITQSAQQGSVNASALNSLGLTPGNKKDLTGYIMNATKVQSLLGQESFKKFTDQNGFLTNLLTQIAVYLMVGWIFAILALSFFAVGFKFIIRVIILWFVIISAPLAFAMRAFSSNERARMLYNEWQSALLKFSFYPAVFLFIFLIITYILQEMAKGNGLIPDIFASLNGASANTETGAVSLGAALANVLIRLGFVVIMLLFGLKAADQIVLHGSSAAEKFTGWASNKVMGWAEGKRLRGLAYRETAGRYANHLNKKVESMPLFNDSVIGARIGNTLKNRLSPLANKSFGGVRSYPQVLKDKKAITDQVAKYNRSSQNATLVKKDVASLTANERNKLMTLSNADIVKLGADNIATLISKGLLAHRLDGAQNKVNAYLQNADISDENKEKIATSWETNRDKYIPKPSPSPATQPANEPTKTGGESTSNDPKKNKPGEPGYVRSTGGILMPDPTAVATGSTTKTVGTGGGGGNKNTGTRSFQKLPELNSMGRDLGRRSRISTQQTGGLARSWDKVGNTPSTGPELVDLTKAMTGMAEVTAKAQAREVSKMFTPHGTSAGQTSSTAQSTIPTKTIPTNMTHSMPTRVAEMNPAAQAPVSASAKTPQAKNPAWWSVPKADPAAEQLRALHGIREAVEEQKDAVNNLADTVAYAPNLREQPPVTINQTVVQMGNSIPNTITPSAKQLLEAVQRGEIPTVMTPELRRTLQENGMSNSDISQKPLKELLEGLKKLQS